MRVEDMIFISVDDHLVEPPDLFEGRLPAKYADRAPRVEHTDAGDDVWIFDHQTIPNIQGSTICWAGPRSEYGVNPTAFDEMRAWLLRRTRAGQGHEADAGSSPAPCFPSFPSFSGRLFLACDDKELALASVQAYNDWHIDEVGRQLSRPFHPDGAARCSGTRSCARPRCAAHCREEGLPLTHVHREPRDPRPAELPRSVLGSALARARRGRHDPQRAHRLVGPARDHRARRADRT